MNNADVDTWWEDSTGAHHQTLDDAVEYGVHGKLTRYRQPQVPAPVEIGSITILAEAPKVRAPVRQTLLDECPLPRKGMAKIWCALSDGRSRTARQVAALMGVGTSNVSATISLMAASGYVNESRTKGGRIKFRRTGTRGPSLIPSRGFARKVYFAMEDAVEMTDIQVQARIGDVKIKAVRGVLYELVIAGILTRDSVTGPYTRDPTRPVVERHEVDG